MISDSTVEKHSTSTLPDLDYAFKIMEIISEIAKISIL